MEKIREFKPVTGYVPILEQAVLHPDGWEIVIFVFPVCEGTCAHCWSSETYFGRTVGLDWYINFFSKIDFRKIREIRLSGGDPLLYKELGSLIDLINYSSGCRTKITILTAGLGFVSINPNASGLENTILNLKKIGVIKPQTSIHLSADENHAGSLFRYDNGIKKRPSSLEKIHEENYQGFELVETQAKNFLKAMDVLSREEKGFRGGKLKVHAASGRLLEYRQQVFSWINDNDWQEKVESSEGLFDSGQAAKNFANNIKILPSSQLSLFIMPGAEFYYQPISKRSQAYNFKGKGFSQVYLDNSKNNLGAAVIGFWNLLEKNFYGGNAIEVAKKYLR